MEGVNMKSLEVSLLVTLAVIISLIVPPRLPAQEEPAYMYLKEQEKGEEKRTERPSMQQCHQSTSH